MICPVPFDIPRADETPEQVQAFRMPGVRASRVKHGSQSINQIWRLASC